MACDSRHVLVHWSRLLHKLRSCSASLRCTDVFTHSVTSLLSVDVNVTLHEYHTKKTGKRHQRQIAERLHVAHRALAVPNSAHYRKGPPPERAPRPPSLHCCHHSSKVSSSASALVHCFQTPVNRSIVWLLKPSMTHAFPRARIQVVPTVHGHHTRHLLRQTPLAAEGTMDAHPDLTLEPKQSRLSAFCIVHARVRQFQGTSRSELPNNLFGSSDANPKVQPFFSQATSYLKPLTILGWFCFKSIAGAHGDSINVSKLPNISYDNSIICLPQSRFIHFMISWLQCEGEGDVVGVVAPLGGSSAGYFPRSPVCRGRCAGQSA